MMEPRFPTGSAWTSDEEHAMPSPDQPPEDELDLDDLDAKVLEDLEADEDADEVRGGNAFTDGCLTR
jgi:hypothetical protein